MSWWNGQLTFPHIPKKALITQQHNRGWKGKEVWRWPLKCSPKDAADNSLSLSVSVCVWVWNVPAMLNPSNGHCLMWGQLFQHASQLNGMHECCVVLTNFGMACISFCASGGFSQASEVEWKLMAEGCLVSQGADSTSSNDKATDVAKIVTN